MPLERSLPVVNWEFCQWGTLRTLATGSELVILTKMGQPGALRTLATGSELGILSMGSP